jgi:exosortase N
MFKSGLLTGAILMTLEEKKEKQYYGIFQILIFCFLIIILNIISNYFRIITLLLFNCTQENILHHGIGLFCFTVYQIIPMFVIIKYLKPKFKKSDSIEIKSNTTIIIVAFLLLLITSLKISNTKNENFRSELQSNFNTKNGLWVNDEVFKIETNSKLIYIKTPSHNPLVCWTGNGYKITESKKIYRNNEEIWLNKMEKENTQYNSYYWYECGNKKYTSFITIMFIKLLYNQPIFLINETSKIN